VTLTELPERPPTSWRKHLVVHLNYGSKGGAATYAVHDERGRKTNIGYAYDTRKSKGAPRGERGFFVNGSELMSWADLRARYAELIKPKDETGSPSLSANMSIESALSDATVNKEGKS
jgi:hypothetical protein